MHRIYCKSQKTPMLIVNRTLKVALRDFCIVCLLDLLIEHLTVKYAACVAISNGKCFAVAMTS